MTSTTKPALGSNASSDNVLTLHGDPELPSNTIRRSPAKIAGVERYHDSTLIDVLENAPVGIHWVDEQGIILWANRTELDMLGYAPAEYIGQPIAKFHADPAAIADILTRLKNGEVLASQEARLRHKDGSIRIGSLNSNVLWENGKFVHTRCFTRDMTGIAEGSRVKGALYRLTDRLQRAGSLEDVYNAALIAIEDALRCHRCSILLLDKTGSMRFVAWRGLSDGYRAAVEGHTPWTLDDLDPEPITIDDVQHSTLSDELKSIVRAEGIQALAFIPLVANGRLIGKFMTYFDTPFVFEQDNIDLSLSIARQLSFGIERKRVEQALVDSERHFRDMIDALPAAIYTTDAEGRLTHFNPAAIELAGRVPQIDVDHWCVGWKLYKADGTPLPLDQCPMAIALKEGRSIRGAEAILERPDGARRWFTPFPTPLKDASGKVIGGINMLVDITERKQVEQTLEQYAKQLGLVTNIAPMYITQCDRDARYKFVNEPYAQLYGIGTDSFKGRLVQEIVDPKTFDLIKPHIEAVLRGERVEFDARIFAHARGERVMHSWYAPEWDSNGEIVGWVAAIADITELKRTEQALRESEEKLKEADRRKDEFLAMLSHELRNPLAPIANAAHLLRREQLTTPTFVQARAIIERQTARLARLVDDLLEVSRISTGRIQLYMERIAIAGIIERSVETVRPLFEQRRHTLQVLLPETAAWVEADGARLEQVLVNLLTNAGKYTDDGGVIQVTVEIQDSSLAIRVKDNGIGIGSELLPRVFDLFTQSERALDRSQGGLGIGLALVDRLVTMHGGTVVAESTLGEGSEFTVTLPLAAAPAQVDTAPEIAPKSSAASLRILVVDDNVDAAKSMAMLMEATGHRAWVAHDGVEALQVAPIARPHLVFLDIGLPKLDGYEVVKKLRPSIDPKTIFVALTGYGQSTDRQRALDAGFDQHLVKPVEFAQLDALMQEAMRLNAAKTP